MSRSEIKNLAKQKIKGNKWNIIWPALVISVISSVLSSVFGPKIDISNIENLQKVTISTGQYAGSLVIAIIMAIIGAGYLKYVLNFARTGKFNTDDIINTIKEKWLDILIANILVGLIVGIGMALFVIPGIIAALALAMVDFIIIDKNAKGSEALKQSHELMKGHKWEYFVFHLSFIGWYLLLPFTLGILLIWLEPYLAVANALYYDNLAKKN